ncbi:MAG: ATP-dependent DNA helicase [Patescibacteria group bacterium]
MKGEAQFEKLYKGLNKAQKEAVDTIEGPVMVIAGPGTGKTQVIALRIGNILQKTDTPADGVLCLTFTNSGVSAMKKRLSVYGIDPSRVVVSTFHAFGTRLIEEFYQNLDLSLPPVTLDEADAVGIVDDILSENDWEHLRPRGDASKYFRDLKSLVSLLIRERMSPEDFSEEIERDIHRIKNDPESISSRGPTKGELKKEAQNEIASLEKSKEAVLFYRLYEEKKRELNVFDYDDILRAMVHLVTEFEDVRAALRERHLYVLVDEHQDSSGVQNEFLKQVWGPVEKPNVFVVGDDRQLIYGFSGASLSLFEEFRESFPGTKLVTLTENYRSTQTILDAADALLKSTLTTGKLSANRDGDLPIALVECAYERDEIMRAGLFFKERIEEGLSAEDCALLVPKNYHVRSAMRVLEDMGLPVSAPGSAKLFESLEFETFFNILKVVSDPFSKAELGELVLDPISGIPPLEAHRFLYKTYSKDLSVEKLVEAKFEFGEKLAKLVIDAKGQSPYEVVQMVGEVFFLNSATEHAGFVRKVEVVRSLLHLALAHEERGHRVSTSELIKYIERLREYGQDVPLALFGDEKGVRIMTLHSSKGLEFEAVWIAHMNERSLMSGKRMGLALPERLGAFEEKKDVAAARREVYVALTRAKSYASLSYSLYSYTGAPEELAAVLRELPAGHYTLETKEESEARLLDSGMEQYVAQNKVMKPAVTKADLQGLVAEEFSKKKVSATALNSFFDCPWQWYFRSFLGVPEPESESMKFGSVVHGSIENVLKLEKKPTDKDIERAIGEALEYHHIFDEKTARRMTKDAFRAVKRFVTDLLPELYDMRETEKPLSGKDKRFPELTITGKIDLLESDGGSGVRVTDFKTGRPRPEKEIEKEDEEGRMSAYLRQLTMYSYLLEHAGKGRFEVEHSRLYFVESDDPKNALYECVITREHLDLLTKDISDFQALLTSGEWTERECHHKAYPGESECPYCKKAEMYQ